MAHNCCHIDGPDTAGGPLRWLLCGLTFPVNAFFFIRLNAGADASTDIPKVDPSNLIYIFVAGQRYFSRPKKGAVSLNEGIS